MSRDLLIHFDGQYFDEGFPDTLPAGPDGVPQAGNDRPEALDLRDLEGTHCYLDPAAGRQLRTLLAGKPLGAVHWIGSGDLHYVSALWAERVAVPFSLVVFDHHPDCQPPAFGRILSCGGWVRDLLLEHPFLQKVLLVGIERDLVREAEDTLREAGAERLAWICDDELENHSLADLAARFGLQGPIYLSLDLDVLRADDFVTSWSAGRMRPEALEDALRWLREHYELLGCDVCGGLSAAAGAHPEDLRRNLSLRRRLLPVLDSLRFR